MDSALTKSLENFKRRAIAQPTYKQNWKLSEKPLTYFILNFRVEKKKAEVADSSKDAKKPKISQSSSSAPKSDIPSKYLRCQYFPLL
jgi:hypothetical protein